MNAKEEVIEYLYQDATMATHTLTELLKELNDKDNKIKKPVEEILKEYEHYVKESKAYLKSHHVKLKQNGFMAKMGANMGIRKEVKEDNSDASMADMLIKGVAMGSIDIEKKIKNYEEEMTEEGLSLAKDFYDFQQEAIRQLKEYL